MNEAHKGYGGLPDDETWQPGDSFKYIPPSDGKHWETILEPLLEKDKAQCAAWKEELQNLVIFAGLFSSVLSAFVVQTYQTLLPDPSDHMIFLLSQIASTVNSQPSNASTLLSPPDFTPDASSVRINVLWLISLVLSLTTVLIAIVASQWLTEHQRYPTTMPTMEKFSLFHMRQEGLQKWHVPEILSSVPLLLLLALVLFLVGLIDFAAGFVRAVAIPVIVVICIPLVFIASTTSLPSLQLLIVSFSTLRAMDNMPSQCPYKSTQSRVLHRILTFSPIGFLISLTPLMILWSLPRHLVHMVPFTKSSKQVVRGILFFILQNNDNCYQRAYKTLCHFWKADSWFSFDDKWMQFRSAYMVSIETYGMVHWVYLGYRGTLYDCTHAVIAIQERLRRVGFKDPTQKILALYHIVDDIQEHFLETFHVSDTSILQQILYSPEDLRKELYSLSYNDSGRKNLRREELLTIFLSKFQSLPPGILADHLLELRARILNYSFVRMHKIPLNCSVPALLPIYVQVQTNSDDPLSPSLITSQDELRSQYSNIIKSYFNHVTDLRIDKDVLTGSFLVDLPSILGQAALVQSVDEIPSILNTLSTHLSLYLAVPVPGSLGLRSDILFFTAAYYGSCTWSDTYDLSAMLKFTSVLRSYVRRRDKDLSEEIRLKLGIPPLPPPDAPHGSWWYFMYYETSTDKEVIGATIEETKHEAVLDQP